jgi:DNA-binding MarR family transcriptional regulator
MAKVSASTRRVAGALAALRDLSVEFDRIDQVAADALGVARSDLRCLDLLSRRGPLTAGLLAAAAGLSAPGLSAAVTRMERLGYVSRQRAEGDRRVVYIAITDKARTVTARVFDRVRSAAAEKLTTYKSAELASVTRFMEDLRAIMAQANAAHTARSTRER